MQTKQAQISMRKLDKYPYRHLGSSFGENGQAPIFGPGIDVACLPDRFLGASAEGVGSDGGGDSERLRRRGGELHPGWLCWVLC